MDTFPPRLKGIPNPLTSGCGERNGAALPVSVDEVVEMTLLSAWEGLRAANDAHAEAALSADHTQRIW